MNPQGMSTWKQVSHQLSSQPRGTILRIEKWRVQHPRDGGMRTSVGLAVGQLMDWRYVQPNCNGLHIREFATYYTAHLDTVNPNCDAAGHVTNDVPQLVGGAALGALIGLLLGGSKEAAMVGAALGALAGAASAAADEKDATPGPRRA